MRLPGVKAFNLALCLCVPLVIWPPCGAAADTTSTLTMSAEVLARSSLRVSSRVLQFDVSRSGVAATASLEFVAASRTRNGAEVILTVEPDRWLEGPGGAADVEASVVFEGDGDGAGGGELVPAQPVSAGRWIGSGRRVGRLMFTLRAGAQGHYRLPISLVLSAP